MSRAVVLCVVYGIALCGAHTWLDCIKDVGQGMNTGVQDCKGFARGYPGRVSGVNIDQVMTYRIQPAVMGQNPPICSNGQQNSNQYTSTYYMTTAKAGDTLRLRWTPNGHQHGAGQDPKTYTIHWTGVPGTQLTHRLDLNAQNQILGPTAFDAECYCDNCAGNPCYGHLRIPPNTPSGVYSFVWYWIFDRDPNAGGEEYTTCFDVNVQGNAAPPPALPTSKPHTSKQARTSQQPHTSQQIEEPDTSEQYVDISSDPQIRPLQGTQAAFTNCTSFCDSMCGAGNYKVCSCTDTERTTVCLSVGVKLSALISLVFYLLCL